MTADTCSRQQIEIFLHELGQPTTVLCLLLEELQDRALSPLIAQDHLRTCMTAIFQVKELCREYQQRLAAVDVPPPLSETKSYNLVLRDQPQVAVSFSLLEELQRLLTMVRYRAREENVRLIVNSHGIPDRKLEGSPLHFRQIVGNFLLNAIQSYTDTHRARRAVRVMIKVLRNTYSITIRDHGRGMTAIAATRLGKQQRTTSRRGHGIGTPLARALLEEEFCGTLIVHSQVGRGTTIELQFPLERKNMV